jgi:uncharacterized protein (TIGR02118 family)
VDIMKVHGPDSFIGILAGALNGSTETTFYVLTLYLGAARVRDVRHALLACLAGDVAGFLGGAYAYATTEHVNKAIDARPLGHRAPGMKMFCPLRRRADLTHEQFVAHWRTTHVPLALEHHPRMVRYVTNVVDQRLSKDGPDWDGFAEISFASADDVRERLFGSPEGERIVRDDIARFIGHTFPYWVGEYVQKE